MVTTLHRRSSAAADAVALHVANLPLRNVFNPSVAAMPDGTVLVATRALGPGEDRPPFHAWLSRVGGEAPPVSLTAHAAAFGVGPVADPKLFVVGDTCWATFNTGSPSGVPNDVFVLPVHPTLGPPLRCVLEPRARLEKNWAFHGGPAGTLGAVYGLSPLQRLVERDRTDDTLVLAHGATSPGTVDVAAGLSLGTPLLQVGDGRWVGVAHQRRVTRFGRAYWGRGVVVDDEGVRVTTPPLLHAWRDALVPAPVRHNPNLWTCTYFAGVARLDGELVVSYGVNDVEGHAAPLPELDEQ